MSVDAISTKPLVEVKNLIWCSYFQVTQHWVRVQWVRVRVPKNKWMGQVHCRHRTAGSKPSFWGKKFRKKNIFTSSWKFVNFKEIVRPIYEHCKV